MADNVSRIDCATESVELVDAEKKIRSAAIGLLARREHSVLELTQKLSKRFPDDVELFEPVLKRLKDDGLQSDYRFAESYLRMRHGRGYGPTRVGLELLQRGVSDQLIALCLEEAEFDWYSTANEVLDKKYPRGVSGFSDRSKAQRFLQYRGFEHEHIREALGGY
ncbi:MAG: regulatory protein RecX [Cellvibrionaceae bacterium]